MEATININKTSRNILLMFLENNSLEKLNIIPEGFSNNLIWNIGHIIVVQQMLVYKLSGLPMMVSDEMAEKYKKGSKPEHNIGQVEVDEIKALLFSTVEQIKKDFAENVFQNYAEFTTGIGFHLTSADDGMEFSNYHEALHLGIMMQIKKFI